MTTPARDPAHPWLLTAVIALQTVCAAVFLGDIIGDLTGRETGEDEGRHAYFEAAATFGLIAAIAVEVKVLRWLLQRKAHLEASLNTAQGAIQDVIESEFSAWKLTPAEQDVATFLVKGLSTAEIAAMRGSAEGTVKAQLNAIYRKSGTASRGELMSLLIDTLMGHGKPAAADQAAV